MSHTSDEREQRLTERERALADARAALRQERAAVVADRAQTDKLLADARVAHRTADNERTRARRLAARFARRFRHTLATARTQLDSDRQAVDTRIARLNAAQSEFHTTAAADRDRMREAWAALDARQRRVAAEWDEANRHHAAEAAAVASRAAELAAREKTQTGERSKLQKEVAALREEAAALDARARNARQVVDELEQRREQLRAESLAPAASTSSELPAELCVALDRAADRDLGRLAAELAAREERLNVERAAVAAVFANMTADKATAADQRRVLAEQFTQLAEARARWQEGERATVMEMEELARALRAREADLDARAQRLARADARRRDDAYDLWQFRLRLEAWQSKLVAYEVRWHTDREQLEADLTRREQMFQYREALLEETFSRWERERATERERLRGELERWGIDRDRMLTAAEACDRREQQGVAELAGYAARALAAEQRAAELARDGDRSARRLTVLRARWEKHFGRALRAVADRRTATATEAAAIEARYRELHRVLADVTEREAAFNNRCAAAECGAALVPFAAPVSEVTPATAPVAELAALREEVERMAAVLLEVELPEPPDPPDRELPWGQEEMEMASEPNDAEVRLFEPLARAA